MKTDPEEALNILLLEIADNSSETAQKSAEMENDVGRRATSITSANFDRLIRENENLLKRIQLLEAKDMRLHETLVSKDRYIEKLQTQVDQSSIFCDEDFSTFGVDEKNEGICAETTSGQDAKDYRNELKVFGTFEYFVKERRCVVERFMRKQQIDLEERFKEMDAFRKDISQLLCDKDRKIAELTKKKTPADRELEQLSVDVTLCKNQINDELKMCEEKKSAAESVVLEKTQLCDKFRSKLHSLNSDLVSVKEKYDILNEKYVTLNEKYVETKESGDKLVACSFQLETVEKKLGVQNAAIHRLKQIEASKNEEIDQLNRSLAVKSVYYENLTKHLNAHVKNLQRQLAEKCVENDKTSQKVQECLNEIDQTKKSIADSDFEIVFLKNANFAENEQLKRLCIAKDDKIENLERDLNVKVQQMSQVNDCMSIKLAEIEALKKDLNNKNAMIERLEKNVDEKIKAHKDISAKLAKEIYEKRICSQRESEEEINGRRKKMRSLEYDLDKKTKKITYLEGRIIKLEDFVKIADGKQAEIESLNRQLFNKTMYIEQLNTSLTSKSTELAQLKAKIMIENNKVCGETCAQNIADIEWMKAIIHQKNAEINQLNESNVQINSEINGLMEKLSAKDSINVDLTKRLSDETAKFVRDIGSKNGEIEKIKENICRKDVKINQLKENLLQLNNEMNDLKEKSSVKDNRIAMLTKNLSNESTKNLMITADICAKNSLQISNDKLLKMETDSRQKDVELAQVKKDLLDKMNHCEKLTKESQGKSCEIKDFTSKVTDLSNCTDDLEERYGQSECENVKLAIDREGQKNILFSMRRDMSQLKSENEEHCSTIVRLNDILVAKDNMIIDLKRNFQAKQFFQENLQEKFHSLEANVSTSFEDRFSRGCGSSDDEYDVRNHTSYHSDKGRRRKRHRSSDYYS